MIYFIRCRKINYKSVLVFLGTKKKKEEKEHHLHKMTPSDQGSVFQNKL